MNKFKSSSVLCVTNSMFLCIYIIWKSCSTVYGVSSCMDKHHSAVQDSIYLMSKFASGSQLITVSNVYVSASLHLPSVDAYAR